VSAELKLSRRALVFLCDELEMRIRNGEPPSRVDENALAVAKALLRVMEPASERELERILMDTGSGMQSCYRAAEARARRVANWSAE
jgi:hypothetical protein